MCRLFFEEVFSGLFSLRPEQAAVYEEFCLVFHIDCKKLTHRPDSFQVNFFTIKLPLISSRFRSSLRPTILESYPWPLLVSSLPTMFECPRAHISTTFFSGSSFADIWYRFHTNSMLSATGCRNRLEWYYPISFAVDIVLLAAKKDPCGM